MKNFPHQFNQFDKLRGALLVIRDLGAAATDDGPYGYELARRGVYTFRNLTTSLDARIRQEELKPTGSQGARTAARETRRTLIALGFVADGATLRLSQAGQDFLASTPGSPTETGIWRTALLQMSVVDEAGNSSRPICILLRLLSELGPLRKDSLCLALEAADDSDVEYARISDLAPLDRNALRASLGVSDFEADNAVKILPSFAEQSGLITIGPGAICTITNEGQAALQVCYGAMALPARRAVRDAPLAPQRTPRPPRIANAPPDAPRVNPFPDIRTLTPDEQRAAVRLRVERTQRHQAVVGRLVAGVEEGVTPFEDPLSYDLVLDAGPAQPLLLVEVKTLDVDAPTQVRLAIGQVLTYRKIVVRPTWPDREVLMAAVFDGDVPPEYVELLEELQIGCVKASQGAPLVFLNPSARGVASYFKRDA
jgi:hypothetical protein